MKCQVVFGFILVAAVLSIGAYGTGTIPASSSPTAPDFSALDDQAASKAADAIVADRRALEQSLTAQLDSEKTSAKRKVLLIYVLGQLRSDWATASLIKIVDFKAPFTDPAIDVGRWGEYPVVDALTAIGKPAVFRIVEALPNENDPLRVRLMLTVIHQVEGAKPGAAWLERGLAKAPDDASRKAIQNALKSFRELAAQFDK